MSELKDDLSSMIGVLGKKWKRAKRQADINDRIPRYHLQSFRENKYSAFIKDAAFRIMDEAYNKASSNGRYVANARQIHYAARPYILKKTGRDKLTSSYFTQTLLKEYLEDIQPSWAENVVWDARGHFREPHQNRIIGLGGAAVRRYISEFTSGIFNPASGLKIEKCVETTGPTLRYGSVLFIEKEGFDDLLEDEMIAETYDVAICSTKGLPVSALCDLAAALKKVSCPIFVIHDFDKSGFSILGSLQRGTRGSRGTGTIIDLGLRLSDIEGLEREPVSYKMRTEKAIENLRENGATEEEIKILVQSPRHYRAAGERVELNAMTSEQFIKWLERKLKEHGIKKIIPEKEVLANAYRRAVILQTIEEKTAELIEERKEEKIAVPKSLRVAVIRKLKEQSTLSWDEAIWWVAYSKKKPKD